MHTTETAGSASGRSGAVSPMIGASLRQSDVDSVNNHRTTLTTPSFRTSTMAIRITTTRTTTTTCALSADTSVTNKSHAGFLFEHLVRAYFDCRKHKRNTKNALAFEVNLERRRTTRRRVLRQAIKNIETVESAKLFEIVNSYYGLLRQSSHSHHDRAKLSHAVLDRGRSVNRQLTKSYRGKAA